MQQQPNPICVMDFSEVLRTTKKKKDKNRIYQEIERKLRIPGLVALHQIAVEQASQPSNMDSILQSMRSLLKNGKAMHLITRRHEQALLINKNNIWDQMIQLEWELEIQDSLFVKENVELLRDGDIVVGEYFTVNQMRQLISASGILFPSIEIIGSYQEVKDRIHSGQCIVENYYTWSTSGRIEISGLSIKECRQAEWTPHEQTMYDVAKGDRTATFLVESMRHCRLHYGGEPELAIQHFANGPFLFLCAHWLMRKCIKERIDCMLMATRDCCLLEKMLLRFQELSTNSIFKKCKIKTFYSSRKCFLTPSNNYLRYTKEIIQEKQKTLYVDIRGRGVTPMNFFHKTSLPIHITILVLQLVGHNRKINNLYKDVNINVVLEYVNHDIHGSVFDVSSSFEPLRVPYDGNLTFTRKAHEYFDMFLDVIVQEDHVNNGIMHEKRIVDLVSLLIGKMNSFLTLLEKNNRILYDHDHSFTPLQLVMEQSLSNRSCLSYDMFDTLVFRRGREPKSIFVQVGQQLGDPDFCFKRMEAERLCNYGNYDQIYQKYHELHPNENASFIKEMEFEMELDNLYPIMSNFLRLKKEDIIISDMYLSETHLRKIIRHCYHKCHIIHHLLPIEERVHYSVITPDDMETIPIFVTLNGKAGKWIWSTLRYKNIECHIGDNEYSDVQSPSAHGIKAYHFTDAHIHTHTKIESYLHNRKQETLANLSRHVRLLNPYSDFRKNIYEEQSQINIPLLVLLAIYLHSLNRRILFMLRDGFYLKMIYDTLYPGNDSESLFCSRKALNTSSPSFVKYMKTMIHGSNSEKKTLIFDLYGTGKSIWQFLQKHDMMDVELFYFLIYDSSQCPRPSHLFLCNSHYIEKMNYVYFGSAVDIDNEENRVRYQPEYDQSIIRVIQQAFNNTMEYISSFREDILHTKEISTEWLIDIFNQKTNILENYCSHVDNRTVELPLSSLNVIHMISFDAGHEQSTAAAILFRHYFTQCTKTFRMYKKESIQHLPGFYSHHLQCWKPFIILNRLLELEEGDLLVYHDSNIFLYPYYTDYCNEFESCVIKIFEKAGTDVILVHNEDGSPFFDTDRLFFRKSSLSLQFVQEWLACCFEDHDDGQAILLRLYKKYIPVHALGLIIQNKVLSHQNIRWIISATIKDITSTVVATSVECQIEHCDH